MDQGTLGAIATVLVFVAFIGVCWWAFSPKRKKRFEEDAQLPFADDENLKPSSKKTDQSDSNNEQAQDNQADHRKGDAERQD